jgi:peptidoglycan/LPS O-acetylase OafA/YrhL
MTALSLDRPPTTSRWERLRARLTPLSSGPGEIASLDGLRAIAALSVMLFHAYYIVGAVIVVAGVNVTYLWFFGQTGVHLFFVLSGFLLFTPFARAMLDGRPLPSVKRFFQRRALRILPAYWVCLAILVLFQFHQFLSLEGLKNLGLHVVMLHDDFNSSNRTINGPFWTLAIEAQFYVVLPLLGWGISKFVGRTRSRLRLLIGVFGVMLAALALRSVDATLHGRYVGHHGLVPTIALAFVHLTLGSQGKYIEVFALGMLCSVLYLAAQDESRMLRRRLPVIGVALVASALVVWPLLAAMATKSSFFAPSIAVMYHASDWLDIYGPLLTGLPYAALTLGVLWAPKWLRAIFEAWPLRWVGLVSYSLYLWHLPILQFAARFTTGLPATTRFGTDLLVGFLVAIPVAYLSYQLVERPFLARRHRSASQGAQPVRSGRAATA